VPEIEIGTPAMGEKEIREMQTISKLGFNFKTLAWCRANKYDIYCAQKTQTNGIHISFPVSKILMQVMDKNPKWVMTHLREMIDYASASFDYVTIGAQDTSRAEMSFLKEFVSAANSFGASRVRLADTVGMLNSMTTFDMISAIRTVEKDIPLEIHAHNDLGMATANTLAAYMAGANCLSTTVNGLGERAGNAPMEEVAMALEMSAKVCCGLQTDKFQEISNYVASVSNRVVGDSKPVTGKMVFTHESGIHTNSILKNRSSYQLLSAEKVGRKEVDFLIGKHSGKSTLEFFMREAGVLFDDAFTIRMLSLVKKMSEKFKRTISKKEFFELYTQEYIRTIDQELSIIKY
jgi:homocitrate synthase NifV